MQEVQELFTTLAAIATIIAGLVALLSLLQALTRSARLRRHEAQWRAALEPHVAATLPTGEQQLLGDLYRHTLAHQLSAHLVKTRWRVRVAAVVLVVLVGAQFLLGLTFYELFHGFDAWLEEESSSFLLLSLLFALGVAWALLVLAGHACARTTILDSILTNAFPVRIAPESPAWDRLRFHHPLSSTASLVTLWLSQVLCTLLGASAWGAVLGTYLTAWADTGSLPDSEWQGVGLLVVGLLTGSFAWGGFSELARRPPAFFSRMVQPPLISRRSWIMENGEVDPVQGPEFDVRFPPGMTTEPWVPPSTPIQSRSSTGDTETTTAPSRQPGNPRLSLADWLLATIVLIAERRSSKRQDDHGHG